jgi:hypothetical protein
LVPPLGLVWFNETALAAIAIAENCSDELTGRRKKKAWPVLPAFKLFEPTVARQRKSTVYGLNGQRAPLLDAALLLMSRGYHERKNHLAGSCSSWRRFAQATLFS